MSNPMGAGRQTPGLPTPPQGWPVGSYGTYAEAQRAVDYLSDQKFHVEDMTIVGVDLMQVERVIGRLTWGKVIGGGLPLSAAVGPAEILDHPPAAALLTTAGNPVCAAAGRAVLKTIVSEGLVDNAAKVGAQLADSLRDLAGAPGGDRIGDVRGRGLAIGLELVDPTTGDRDPRLAAAVVYRAWELGAVVYYVGGNVLEITPPLVLAESQAARAAEILGAAIGDAAAGKVDAEEVAKYAGW